VICPRSRVRLGSIPAPNCLGGLEPCRLSRNNPFDWNLLFQPKFCSDYTALQQYGKGKSAIPVEKRGDSVPPWTRPRNWEPSLSISRTLFSPPLFSATRITGLAIIVSLPEGATARDISRGACLEACYGGWRVCRCQPDRRGRKAKPIWTTEGS
jgi:hypothetical protein